MTTDKYDVNGDLVSITTTAPQGSIIPNSEIDYTDDLATGRETGVTTTNTALQYGYNEAGELTSVTVTKLDDQTVSLVTAYAYDLDGRPSTTENANGTTETRTYDAPGRLKSIADALGSSTIASFAYTYDASGHVRTETDLSGRTDTYTYDEDNRLVKQAISDPSAGASKYTDGYDLVGNRATEMIVTPSGTQNYSTTYDDNDEIITITGPSTVGVSRPDSVPNLTRRFARWLVARADVRERLAQLEDDLRQAPAAEKTTNLV